MSNLEPKLAYEDVAKAIQEFIDLEYGFCEDLPFDVAETFEMLALDSLDVVKLQMYVEGKFDFDMPLWLSDVLTKLVTPDTFCKLVVTQIENPTVDNLSELETLAHKKFQTSPQSGATDTSLPIRPDYNSSGLPSAALRPRG